MRNAFAVSDVTQRILKNFSGIADSMVLNAGATQRTVLQSKSVFAVAELPDVWPQETALYNVKLFVSVLSQFDKPSIRFDADAMVVFQENSPRLRIKYRYSDASTIDHAPTRTLPTNDPAVEVIVSSYTLNTIKKTASLLNLTHFTAIVENGGV